MTTAKFRMHGVSSAPKIALNSSQQAVLALPVAEVAAVFGAPGSGKTATLKSVVFEQVLANGQPSDSHLVIAATRQNANRLRDELALGLQSATKGPIARTLSSVAFAVVAAKALTDGDPLPELLSGSEQDTMLEQIIAELAASNSLVWPASIHKNTLRLPAFRAEIRELLTVATEHRVSPERLSQLSSGGGLGVWFQVAQVYSQYLERLNGFDQPRFDSAQLLHRAADLLDEGFWPENLARPTRVLVDDAQELTPGASRLLRSVVGPTCGLLLFGDPDASTLGFRASDSKAMTNLVNEVRAQRGSVSSAPALFLETRVDAKPPLLGHVLASISEKVSPDLAGRHRYIKLAKPDWSFESETHESEVSRVIETASFTSSATEVSWVADRMRYYHLEHGVEWKDMAVVARSRRLLDELELTLSNHQVPARVGGAQSPLRDEFGSRSLLRVAKAVVEPGEIDLTTAIEMLQNAFLGLNNLELRRLRRTLRYGQKDSQDPRNSDELIVELFNKPATFAEQKSRELISVRKFLEKLHRLRAEYSEGALGVEQLLWQIYEGSQVAIDWFSESSKHTQTGAQANRNLDAISALFAVAKRFAERHPGSPAKEFIEKQLALGLPEDTLLKDARAIDRVLLLTPAGLIGQQFKVIVTPGLIDGIWPNPRPRSTLLGARALDQLARNLPIETETADELASELRMFYKTVGAATEHLIATVTEGENDTASKFFEMVLGGLPPLREMPMGQRSLRVLTGKLRRALVSEVNLAPFDDQKQNVAALAQLALAGVPGASPEQWMGILQPSTDEALFYEEGELTEQIRISPSQLQRFIDCPLHWFINNHGGDDTGFEAGLGTILHAALENSEAITEKALQAEVDKRWHSLRFEADWMNQFAQRKARNMIQNLAEYLTGFDAAGGKVLGSEVAFNFEQGDAIIAGRIDRIEETAEGKVLVVDLKTSKKAPSKPDVEKNVQLLTYQLAVANDSLKPEDLKIPLTAALADGAKLVVVGGEKPETPSQQSFTENTELKSQIIETINKAAKGMAKNFFVAQIGEHCTARFTYSPCKLHIVEAVTYVE